MNKIRDKHGNRVVYPKRRTTVYLGDRCGKIRFVSEYYYRPPAPAYKAEGEWAKRKIDQELRELSGFVGFERPEPELLPSNMIGLTIEFDEIKETSYFTKSGKFIECAMSFIKPIQFLKPTIFRPVSIDEILQ